MAASSSEHATESLLGRWDVLLPDDECTVFSSFLYICGYNKASSSSCIREYPRSCGYTEKSDCGDLGHLPTVCLLQKSSKIPGLGKNLFVLPMSVGAGARVLAKESHLVILFFFNICLFGCTESWLLHTGPSVFIMECGVCGRVGSFSLFSCDMRSLRCCTCSLAP